MAQLVARLVRNEKVGGSNPPSSTTGRHPIRVSVFCMPGRVGAVPVVAVPLVFRAPDGPAAREARHPHFVRCRASKPARALRSLRRPSHRRRLVAVSSPARPRHRPRAPRPGPPAPSTPVGPVVLMRIHIIAEPTPNFACNSPTTLSNPEIRSLELQRFLTLLKLHLIELHATFLRQAPPPPTGAADDSRETVNTFAGVCSVSGETGDTIASQIYLFSAQFWRAKASWVSWRRTEAPAMVLTVSSCGAVSSMGATKFAQRRLSMAIARKYSPSVGKMAQNGRFMACWASFFAEMAHMASRWASFRAHRHRNQARKPPLTLRPGRSMRACPLYRRNLPRTWIGYCGMDRL